MKRISAEAGFQWLHDNRSAIIWTPDGGKWRSRSPDGVQVYRDGIWMSPTAADIADVVRTGLAFQDPSHEAARAVLERLNIKLDSGYEDDPLLAEIVGIISKIYEDKGILDHVLCDDEEIE